MRVENRIKNEVIIQFKDLAVGDVYEDDEGIICIKTSNENYGGSPYGKCIALINDKWSEEEEHEANYVKPLEATITLHGYKMKARN